MEYYESYFDEDLDEELSEGYDEASEGYDESGDLSENREKLRARRLKRSLGKKQGLRKRRRGGGQSDGKPASTGAVKAAFADAKVEVANVKNEVKKAEVKQANEQMNDIIASFLFRPKLETGKMAILTASEEDPTTKKRTYTVDATKLVFVDDNNNPILGADGNPIPAVVGTKLVDNLLALMAVKFIGNMKGVDTSKGFQQYLPLLAGVALSPSVQKDLGLGGLLGTGSGTSSDNGGLSNLTKNPAVLLLLLLFFMKK